MTKKRNRASAPPAFEARLLMLPLDRISPLYKFRKQTRGTMKYRRIAASIREVGLVEPLVVVPANTDGNSFTLLDGHLRLAVLLETGAIDALCQISTDDEAFTYNRRISRLAIVQEHKMILKALERGVPEERLARALSINIASLRAKKRLLDGICTEAAELLKDRHVSLTTFRILRKMKPMRQIEASELMVAMNRFTVDYARSLLAATADSQLVAPDKPKASPQISRHQLDLMERESAGLERELRLVEAGFGRDHLDLVLAHGYLVQLLANGPVEKYLGKHFPGILNEFRMIAERTAES